MKEVSRGQALQVAARVGLQVKWEEINGERLQAEVIDLTPEEFGKRFTAFLKNGCHFISGDPKSFLAKSFNPTEFIGKEWTIWKGSAKGEGLSGKKDQDERSLALTEISLASLRFETCLKKGETSITGEEKLIRLKNSKKILLGGNAFLGLWLDYQANKENSALEWLWRNYKISYLDFFGEILRGPDGRRRVLYFCRHNDGEWFWHCHWLDNDWNADDPSAVLASDT
jgi:hypothetical protein